MKKPPVIPPTIDKKIAYNTYPDAGLYQVYCTANVLVTHVNDPVGPDCHEEGCNPDGTGCTTHCVDRITYVWEAVDINGNLVETTFPSSWIPANDIRVALPGSGAGREVSP